MTEVGAIQRRATAGGWICVHLHRKQLSKEQSYVSEIFGFSSQVWWNSPERGLSKCASSLLWSHGTCIITLLQCEGPNCRTKSILSSGGQAWKWGLCAENTSGWVMLSWDMYLNSEGRGEKRWNSVVFTS